MLNRVSRWIRGDADVEIYGQPSGGTTSPPRRLDKRRRLTESHANSIACQNGPFFEKLPAEIRRQILIEAFGDRVVHIDVVRGATQNQDHSQHRHGRWPSDNSLQDRLDQWILRGSVCHRNPPYPGRLCDQVQPSQDRCRFGRTPDDACKLWPGDHPSKCAVGAMGWLISCRQAYTEGIDVLYSTNTIHSASKEFMMNMHSHLTPERISAIKSVELLWDVEPLSDDDNGNVIDGPLDPRIPFQKFLNAVPTMFPALRSLYISIQGDLQLRPGFYPHFNRREYAEYVMRETEQRIMRPVDEMVRKLGPQVRECSIAVPSTMYAPRRAAAREAGFKVELACDGKLERAWRALEDGSAGRGGRDGYWVRLGFKDLKRQQAYLNEEVLECSPRYMENWILYDVS